MLGRGPAKELPATDPFSYLGCLVSSLVRFNWFKRHDTRNIRSSRSAKSGREGTIKECRRVLHCVGLAFPPAARRVTVDAFAPGPLSCQGQSCSPGPNCRPKSTQSRKKRV